MPFNVDPDPRLKVLKARGLHATRMPINEPDAIQMPTTLMERPRFNTSGKAAQIQINSHKILEYPTRTVHQYDVC